MSEVSYVAFEPHHVDGVVLLTSAEGWPTLADDWHRAVRVLLAPGAVTVVALDGDEVVGFARALGDGEWVACLTDMVVAASHRRHGIGRQLIDEVFIRSGAQRLDLLAEPGSEPFYESRLHRRWTGYRLYPPGTAEA
jgi:GNAT superfamily N-acetyltransferase